MHAIALPGSAVAIPPRRQESSFFDYAMANFFNQDRRRNDDDISLALALVNLMARQEDTAEMRRQFDALQRVAGQERTEDKRRYDALMAMQEGRYQDALKLTREQWSAQQDINKMQNELFTARLDEMGKRLGWEAKDRERVIAELGRERSRQAGESAVIKAEKRIAGAGELAATEAGIESRTLQNQIAAQVSGDMGRIETGWLSYEQSPKTWRDANAFADRLEKRLVRAKTDTERSELATAALPEVDALISSMKGTSFDTTSPLADINPASWLWGGGRVLAGLPYNSADAAYREGILDRLQSTRFMLSKYYDPEVSRRQELGIKKKTIEEARKIEEVQDAYQRALLATESLGGGAEDYLRLSEELNRQLSLPPSERGAGFGKFEVGVSPAPQSQPTTNPSPQSGAWDMPLGIDEEFLDPALLAQLIGGAA